MLSEEPSKPARIEAEQKGETEVEQFEKMTGRELFLRLINNDSPLHNRAIISFAFILRSFDISMTL